MRSRWPVRRETALSCPLLLLALACGDGGAEAPAAGGSGPAAMGGNGASSGTGLPAPTGGTPAVGAGGTGSAVPLAGSGQALGGGDQGALFEVGVAVTPVDTGGMANGGSGGSGIPGDGKVATSTIRGSLGGTAVFSQTGVDVTLVVNLTSCADGNHQFRIHDGYSCDNGTTMGMPWAGRGTGIGPDSGIACSGGKGTLTYTRLGADTTKNWTVADHNQQTDVTAHVVIVSDEKDPNSRAACGNFF